MQRQGCPNSGVDLDFRYTCNTSWTVHTYKDGHAGREGHEAAGGPGGVQMPIRNAITPQGLMTS